MKSPRVVAFLLTLALSVTVFGADKRPLTPQDLWAIKRLGGPALSPDGKTVVFTVQDWSIEKNKSTSSLWLVDTAGGAPHRQLRDVEPRRRPPRLPVETRRRRNRLALRDERGRRRTGEDPRAALRRQ
ncbi:MAG: hypothetical protein PSU94_13380 [Lacunisphaera sp.]|nr:hypothetical protein [Lacunisphaera sp.]